LSQSNDKKHIRGFRRHRARVFRHKLGRLRFQG
jgi:hypothetical protein